MTTTQSNPQPLLPPRALRISEAAKYISASPWFIEVEIRAGRLPAMKLGRRYVIAREDLDIFIDDHRARLRRLQEAA
jgi:excisionase family DNA binding protein